MEMLIATPQGRGGGGGANVGGLTTLPKAYHRPFKQLKSGAYV